MTLPSPPPGQAGGFLALQYINTVAGEVHSMRLHVCWYDQAPTGSANDHAYITGGPVTPGEASLQDTYAALAALWQPYYSPDWELVCSSLAYNAGGFDTLLLPGPNFPTYRGTDARDVSQLWALDRKIKLLGRTGAFRHLWLTRVPDTVLRPKPFEVTPSSGGVDARDQAWIAYLSGATAGGAVVQDGTYCFPVTDMQVWWARQPMCGPYVTTG